MRVYNMYVNGKFRLLNEPKMATFMNISTRCSHIYVYASPPLSFSQSNCSFDILVSTFMLILFYFRFWKTSCWTDVFLYGLESAESGLRYRKNCRSHNQNSNKVGILFWVCDSIVKLRSNFENCRLCLYKIRIYILHILCIEYV